MTEIKNNALFQTEELINRTQACCMEKVCLKFTAYEYAVLESSNELVGHELNYSYDLKIRKFNSTLCYV